MIKVIDYSIERIFSIWKETRKNKSPKRFNYPMIILRIPKGWTAPKR